MTLLLTQHSISGAGTAQMGFEGVRLAGPISTLGVVLDAPSPQPLKPPTMRQAWHEYRKAVPLYAEIVTAPLALALLPVAATVRAERKVKGWIE